VATGSGVRELVESVSLTFVALALWRRAGDTRRGEQDRIALTGSPLKGKLAAGRDWAGRLWGRGLEVGKACAGGS
jgi:hypothetical protein